MKQLLEPFNFTFSQLQNIATFLKHLRKNSKTTDDFINYVEKMKSEKIKLDRLIQKEAKRSKENWVKNAPKCPECKETMNLHSVNTNSRNQIDNNFKSQWICPNCGYDKYDTKTVKEIMQSLDL